MSSEPDDLQRTVLPVPDQAHRGLVTYDAKDPDTSFEPIVPLRPPPGAPNVLLVLLDDVGFGAASAFGGPCATPTAERLAAGGLCYGRFHTTAAANAFNGKVRWVQIDVDEEDGDHLVHPEDRLRMIMARQ